MYPVQSFVSDPTTPFIPAAVKELHVEPECLIISGTLELQDINEEPAGSSPKLRCPPPSFAVPEADQLLESLAKWEQWLLHRGSFDEKEAQIYFQWMAALPLPTEDYWQIIPKEDIKKCLSYFKSNLQKFESHVAKIKHLGKSDAINKQVVNYYYFVVMETAAIAYELLSRLYPEQMHGWGVPWESTFVDRVLSEEMFLSQGPWQRKLYALASYFQQQAQSKKGTILIYDRTVSKYSHEGINFHQQWDQIEDKAISQLTPLEQQFKFLSQFMPKGAYSLETFAHLLNGETLNPYHDFARIMSSLCYLGAGMTISEKGHMQRENIGYSHVEDSNSIRATINEDTYQFTYMRVSQGGEGALHFSPQVQTHPEYAPLLSEHSSQCKNENSRMAHWHEVAEDCSLEASQKVLAELSELAAPHNQNNRVILAITWMEKRGAYLRHANIQKYIFKLLLSGLCIEQTCERAPYVIEHLRSFLGQLVCELAKGGDRERQHLAFWLRLGYLVETRLTGIKSTQSHQQIIFYQGIIQKITALRHLNPLHAAEFKLLWVLVHSHLPAPETQKIEQFVRYLLEVNEIYLSLKAVSKNQTNLLALEKLELLRLEAGSAMVQWQKLLQEHFKDIDIQQWLEHQRISASFRGKKILGKFPFFRIRGQTLDLIFGHYEGRETRERVRDLRAFDQVTLKEVLGINPETVVDYDPENEVMSDFNGSYRCFKVYVQPPQPLLELNYTKLTDEQHKDFSEKLYRMFRRREQEAPVITKQITHNGVRGKYAYIKEDQFDNVLPRCLWKNHIHWLSMDLTEMRYILIFDKEGLPCSKLVPIQGQKDQFAVLRLNKKGNESGEQLVVFQQLSPHIKEYVKCYIDEQYLNDALVWVKDGCITRISFPDLKLTFIPKVSTRGVRLASKEFPGHFLIDHVAKGDALPKGAFLIGKSSQKQFVIIPTNDPLSPTVSLTWNRRRHFFEAQSPEQQLCFLSFLLQNGYCLQAKHTLDSLESLHHYGQSAYSILDTLAQYTKQSPEPQVLYVHLLLHFLDNQQQLFAKNARQAIPYEWEMKNLLKKIGEEVASLKSGSADLAFGFTPHQIALLNTHGIKTDHLPHAPLVKKLPPQQMDNISKECNWYPFPLNRLAAAHYTTQGEDLPAAPFALATMQIPDGNVLAKKMHAKLTEAHAINSTRQTVRYIPKSSKEDIQAALKEQMDLDKQKVTELMLKIEQTGNRGLQAIAKPIVFHDQILRSLMKQDPTLLCEANSALSEDDVKQLWNMATQLMLVATRVDQAKEALRLSDLHEIAKVVHKQRGYDPSQYPQFLIYEYTTGLFLRPEQIDMLKWILDQDEHSSQLLAEFQAGGGKTKVISPLLCFFAIQKGLMPIFFSLPATYPVVKQDFQQSLQNVFEIKTHVLEIDLESELSDESLAHILALLHRWHAEGAAVVITPVAYHKLRLCLYQSLDPNSPALAILTFLQKNSLFIIDEAHRNLVSTWQAIVAMDEKPCLQKQEQDLFITIYKLLTGVIPCSVHTKGKELDLGTYVRLKEDGQSSLRASQKSKALEAIASWLCHQYFPIDPQEREGATDYLCNKHGKCPEWAKTWEPNQRDLFFLAKGLLTQVLKTSLKMMHQFDYGAPMEGYSMEMPRQQMAATGAQFANPDLAAALTCQGLYQRGLDLRQFTEMLQAICERHKLESMNVDPENTKMARMLNDWQIEAGLSLPVFIGDVRDEQDVLSLHEKLKRQPLVIEHYLAHYLLAKVKDYNRQRVSTAAELNGGGRSILFSATLGMAEEYPAIAFTEQKGSKADQPTTSVQRVHRDDLAFQAAVIQQACTPTNSQSLWLESSLDPDVFFEQVYTQDKTLFSSLEGIIDVGGWHRYSPTQQVAESFLRCNQKHQLGYQGAVFMREESAGKSSMQLILAKEDNYEYIDVCGTDFLGALKNRGFEHPEQVRLFKIYGPSQATGTDMYLSKKAKMLLTVGSKSTLWDQIQAIMRCRKFLEPIHKGSEGQSIVWVGSKTLRKKVAGRTSCQEMSLTPVEILKWCFEQEMRKAKPRIILQACQSILHVIRGAMETKLSTHHQWVADHQSGVFLEEVSRDLALQYAGSMEEEPTKTILEKYTKALLNQAGLQPEDFSDEQPKITAIIVEAETQVATAPANPQSSSTSTIQAHQQHQNQQQFHQENTMRKQSNQFKTSADTALPQLDYAQSTLSCVSDGLAPLHNGKTIFSANATFCPGENFFYKNLFFLGNVCNTTQEKSHALKTIDFFLLVITENEGIESPQIYCVSHEDAEEYAKQLAAGKTNGTRYMALCSSSGHLAQNGSKNGIPEALWMQMTQSPIWQHVINQIALLNCRTIDNAFLVSQLSLCLEQGMSEAAIGALFESLSESQYFSSPSDGEYLHSFLQQAQKHTSAIQDPIAKPTNVARAPAPYLPARVTQATGPEKVALPPVSNVVPSVQTASKVHELIVFLVALLILVVGVAGGLSMVGGYCTHAPQFAIDLYKALPHWATYAMVATSGSLLIGLITYAIYSCYKSRIAISTLKQVVK